MLRNRDLRNRIGGFLFGFSWAASLIFFFLIERWVHSAPSKPDAAHGLLFAHNEHGTITYFSAFQATSGALMFWSASVGTVLALVTLPKQETTIRRWGRMPIAASWKPDDPKGLRKLSAMFGIVTAPVAFLLLGPFVVMWLNRIGIVLHF